MHEAGTLNPTYYDGIIVLSQRTGRPGIYGGSSGEKDPYGCDLP